MPSVVTRKFRLNNVDQLYESFSEASPTRYYVYVGRPTAFANDASPTTPTDSVFSTEYDSYRDMVAMKRVQASDVSYVVNRYDWTSGTVYKEYRDTDASLYSSSTDATSNTTFYVITSDNYVYKCIDNGRGLPSTVKPTNTGTSIFNTADGYRWKFMYSVSTADRDKFLLSSHMPVKTLTANDGSAQWAVQQAASNGSIDHIRVTANGASYLTTTNTFSTVTNGTSFILNTNARGTDGIYVGSTIFLSSGLGSGQLRRIVRYAGSTRRAYVNGAFTVTPNTSTTYLVGPNVVVTGDSGSTSSNRATAYVSNCAGGQVRKITMISRGLHYGYANVSVTANSSHGSGATAAAVLSPPGGHGKDPVAELGATSILLNVRLTGIEANTFPSNNDFRVVGILRDPRLRSGPVANASVIDQCSRLSVYGVSGDFIADEVVTGGTSGVKGRLVYFANTNAARTKGTLKLTRVSTTGTGGFFVSGEIVTGATSGKVATVNTAARPAVREYTGDIIYIENRSPVTRTPYQIEDIKLVVKF